MSTNKDDAVTVESLEKKYGQYFHFTKDPALAYGQWIIKNCIVARDGFRMGTSNWSKVISNEDAYEMYLESLKSKNE